MVLLNLLSRIKCNSSSLPPWLLFRLLLLGTLNIFLILCLYSLSYHQQLLQQLVVCLQRRIYKEHEYTATYKLNCTRISVFQWNLISLDFL